MRRIFISDLHLDQTRDHITGLFLEFLEHMAQSQGELYILGDLFEAWIGDDCVDELGQRVAVGIRSYAQKAGPVYFMAGNRDFLLGESYATTAGMQILEDPTLIQLGQRQALISHGDAMCIDDVAYQAFRSQVRNADWQAAFLQQSINDRLAFAEQARAQSKAHTSSADMAIMDVNQTAVENIMQAHGVPLLIHGHTHRPAIHEFSVAGKPCNRVVLGDWYDNGSVLIQDGETLTLTPFTQVSELAQPTGESLTVT